MLNKRWLNNFFVNREKEDEEKADKKGWSYEID